MTFFALVDPGIKQVEARIHEYADGYNHDLREVLEQILTSGGKRIRPTLVLLTAGMLGGDEERMINLAAAIEMLHTATLVHDDLIDGALLRRGSPTLNTHWSPAATVLAGDYLFARAAELAALTESVVVMQIFARTLSTIVCGEINQLLKSRGLVSRDDYFKRIYAKTASLFETALQTSAILSTSDPNKILSMKQYGYEIGMAFQIMDDILDFTGDQSRVGKPVASDLRQGLATLPIINYLEANPDDVEMQAVLKGFKGDEHQISRLVAKIRTSGAIELALDEAQRFVDQAIRNLTGIPACQEKKALIEVANFIVSREI
jgi:geranylgeranyl pyrophosphate synthase